MEVHPTLFSCCFTSSLGMLCINARESLKFWSLYNLQFCLIFSYVYTYSILHFVDLNTRVRSSQIYFFRNNLLLIFIKLWRNIYCNEFCMYILVKNDCRLYVLFMLFVVPATHNILGYSACNS